MIKNYEEKYIKEIVRLTVESWHGEFEMSPALETFVYNFLPRYYLSAPELSYVDLDDEGFNGFFIVSHGDRSSIADEFYNCYKAVLNEDDKMMAGEYKKYLEYNHEKVLSHMEQGDLYLALLASRKKGCGSSLWNKVTEDAREAGIRHMYFWTDETCDYHYYDGKGYDLVETYYQESFGRSIKTFIYRVNV